MYLIGSICKLKRNLLGNSTGTMGVVYELYPDPERPGELGISVIFQNGKYSRFSVKDQELILTECGFSPDCCGYLYRENQQLTTDFNNGFFVPAFLNGLYLHQREETIQIEEHKRSSSRNYKRRHPVLNVNRL